MTNHLATETSPYLQQHAENPVDWYPWGDEAFERARTEDKPILLSVGYAACHWCHVMAHESFEDPRIAALMNERFISVKVDRQERPDIDGVYQKVTQMMGQSGGWPLTVFLTPKGEPFFGGTYFPPEDRYGRPGFMRVLEGLSDAWRDRRSELHDTVEQFRQGFLQVDRADRGSGSIERGDLPAEAARALAQHTDLTQGGLGAAPKFPNVSCYDLVLRVYSRTSEPALFQALTVTLDSMAAGGIYDHLGGGFARYSVDDRWAVPHFEKMLYDNGQLAKLYADAYRRAGKPAWRRVAEETAHYVMRDMTSPEGGFYAGEDADSEGVEGKFYVWTPAQIRSVLGEADGALACRVYGVSESGNFEGGATVLHRPVELSGADESSLPRLRDRLLAARTSRVRPGRDENILAGWNALMIQGLCAVFQATGTTAYLQAAQRAADFIQQSLTMPDGGVYRAWRGGVAKVPGFLEDYAFLSNALLDLYESCFEKRYLDRALELVTMILDRFWENGLYFTSRDSERLMYRPRSPYDEAWPSGLSSGVFAFLRVYELTGDDMYRRRAEHELARYQAAAVVSPAGFAHLLAAQDFSRRNPFSVIFAGGRRDAAPLVESVHRAYVSARVLAFAEDVPTGEGRAPVNGRPTAYVCRNRVCAAPVTSVDALRRNFEE
ncbi:MAG: thioredoxin domain-containing protein [Burkholderiaceae bacterium]|nr:MAG: thioredoxin domain-containing protein [Burkholderiaceae bacterium]TAM05195.1 MAG: thioredoxin domain-containing protein [Pusillimonas sp.]